MPYDRSQSMGVPERYLGADIEKIQAAGGKMVNPRAGHLKILYHMFVYLKSHPDMGELAHDPKEPKVDESIFNRNTN
eukprot:15335669-Ditylum_brightwellii.AAC.2